MTDETPGIHPSSRQTDAAAPACSFRHAAVRARERLRISPDELEVYWSLSREARDADLARFATIAVAGCAYRVVVARHRLGLLVRDAATDHPITVRPIPRRGS